MSKKPDCAGCGVTDDIKKTYISWIVASAIIGLLLVGIAANFQYTEIAINKAEAKMRVIDENQDVQDQELKEMLGRMERKIDDLHDAVIIQKAYDRKRMQKIAAAFSILNNNIYALQKPLKSALISTESTLQKQASLNPAVSPRCETE